MKPEANAYPQKCYAGWFDPHGTMAGTEEGVRMYNAGWRDGIATVFFDGMTLILAVFFVVGVYRFLRDNIASAFAKAAKAN